MLQFRTQGFHGSGVVYSPFLDNRLAVSGAANFGLVGNGRLSILDIGPDAQIHQVASFDTQDSMLGLCWSEAHENHVATANGDGSIRLFDVTSLQPLPLQIYREHRKEVFSVQWCQRAKDKMCSASWDGTIKIWDPHRTRSLQTYFCTGAVAAKSPASTCIYTAKYNPRDDNMVLTAQGDGVSQILDLRTGCPVLQLSAITGTGDALSADWNKYIPTSIATAGVDKQIKIWDIRNPSAPANCFVGHQLAVRSVAWSPHSAHHLVSTSYDMTVKVWLDTADRYVPGAGVRGLVADFLSHKEFTTDASWALWGEPGWIASVAWDEMVYIWKCQC